jgi:FtsZ-binding cell division protein ZapB
MNEQIRKEALLLETKDNFKKQQIAQETCGLLQNLIEEKKERQRVSFKESQELEKKNDMFNDFKFMVRERRQNYDKGVVK